MNKRTLMHGHVSMNRSVSKLTLDAYDLEGNLVGIDTITVTHTVQ